MQRATLVLVLLAVLPAWADFKGRVVGVSEGDVVKVRDVNRVKHAVRLQCIDAPELGQAYGEAARDHLAALVSGRVVKVRGEAGDPGTRITGELQLGAINVNLRMVDDGYAWKHPKDACGGAYEDAESAARTAGRGLWQTGSPVPPWEFKLR